MASDGVDHTDTGAPCRFARARRGDVVAAQPRRLAAATGINPPNPWNARVAIFGTAMLMADNGADQGTTASERRAALRYFAGGNWNKPSFAFYGDGVMGFAASYQRDIDVLEGR